MDNTTKIEENTQEGVYNSFSDVIFQRFKTLLNKKGLRQIDIANHLRVNKGYVWAIMHGKREPPIHIKIQIAQFLETDTSVIWGSKDEK